jgi:hypothetical protein
MSVQKYVTTEYFMEFVAVVALVANIADVSIITNITFISVVTINLCRNSSSNTLETPTDLSR